MAYIQHSVTASSHQWSLAVFFFSHFKQITVCYEINVFEWKKEIDWKLQVTLQFLLLSEISLSMLKIFPK